MEVEPPTKREALAEMNMGSRTYDVLKAVAQVWLPAAGTLYFALAQIWGLPAAEQVSGTVLAVDTFLGVVLGISSASYNASDRKYDGTLRIEDGEDGSTLRLAQVDAKALTTKNEVVFKIVSS
jgi:putative holin Dp-1